MPNRIIKESICTSNEVEKLTWQQEVFWYRLLVQCDDYGRMDARPEILRAKCFPLRLERVSAKDISGFMKVMVDTGLIEVYVVEGIPYLHVLKWEIHQQVRAKRSKYPAFDELCNQMIADDSNGKQAQSDVTVIQSNPNPIQSNAEKHFKKYDLGLSLSEDEFKKLVDKFGSESRVEDQVQAVINYSKSKGIKYKSLYDTILSWDRLDKKRNPQPASQEFRRL